MKIFNPYNDDRIHVMDVESDVWSVLTKIADSGVQEEAFYVCDVGDIVKKYEIWKSLLPRVEPHYAVKCNDSLTVLEVLAALGVGFDCASKVEISKVLSMGVNPNRIIFANPTKPASYIRHAAATGVSTMTFDNELELYKIHRLYPEARLVIRLRCDATEADYPLGTKFGCDPITEAPYLLQVAKSLGFNVAGVSFHVGSGCREALAFKRAIETSRKIFDYAATLGYDFELLDIGGGYPGAHGSTIEDIAQVVNAALEAHFSDPAIRVISEPGTFFVASAFTLTCNIHSIREGRVSDVTSKRPNRMYYINDGLYGSFDNTQKCTPLPLRHRKGARLLASTVWGPTCDSLDKIVEDVDLPEMWIGDWIVFENMGAYSLSLASHFNGIPISKVHAVADENVWLMLKDRLPLSEDHFVEGNIPENLKLGLDLRGLVAGPISLQLPRYNALSKKLNEASIIIS